MVIVGRAEGPGCDEDVNWETGGRPPTRPEPSRVSDPTLRLGQYLKFVAHAGTGGEAKILIQQGCVKVNGEVETRRGRQVVAGDRIEVDGQVFVVGQDP